MKKPNINPLAFLMAMTMAEETEVPFNPTRPAVIKLPYQAPPPAGTKEYWFNAQGEFSSERMRRDETVFTCYAINDKNALRKYNKWKSSRP